jgi:hypothetical protein
MVKYFSKWSTLIILTATSILLSMALNIYQKLNWQIIGISLLFSLLPVLFNAIYGVYLFSTALLFGEKIGLRSCFVKIIKTVLLNNAILIPIFLICIILKYIFAADSMIFLHITLMATKLIMPLFIYITYKFCMQTSWEESAKIVSIVLIMTFIISKLGSLK